MNYSGLKVRRCDNTDVPQIYGLQEKILEELENKEVLRKNTKEMFARCAESPNLTIGVFQKQRMIALAILADAGGTEEDLGRDLVLHQIEKAANLKLVLVAKEFRGNGFQKALMWLLEKYAYHKGFRYLCATVSPHNQYSLHNIIASGYEYDHDAVKYGGLSRQVYVKNIRESVEDYNREIMRIAGVWDGRRAPYVMDRCFEGELGIACTGDILEYDDGASGTVCYGILRRDSSRRDRVILPGAGENGETEDIKQTGALKLKRIWLMSGNCPEVSARDD